ncbi:hypothetical protein [Actinoplanes subtropicus]|uniref:hypothetical protein n=1 Tax=Actinoplanes subtropicus TaxID=543632 RepID=UPI0004C335D0|nr:hypothetical protein [Actinoplanes subtropicus]
MHFLTSPADDRLLDADRSFHVAFLVVGGLCTLLLLVLSGFCWVRFRRAGRRTFARRSYFWFGTASLILGLLMVVVCYANVTSVVNPGQTLAGTSFSPLGETWLRAGSAQISPALQHAIDERLAWQRPKAIICGVLLVAVVTLSVLLWRTLIRRSATSRLMLAAGVLSAIACLPLMLMVIGNTEGAYAPLFLAVLYG